ncbi:MAG: hypothetical protein WB699_07085 [Bacteroidota bacterium]
MSVIPNCGFSEGAPTFGTRPSNPDFMAVCRLRGYQLALRAVFLVFAFSLFLSPLNTAVALEKLSTTSMGASSEWISLKRQEGDSQSEVQQQRSYVLRPMYSLEGHLHNKIIHVPIGFGLAAIFLSILGLRWQEYQPGVRWLVLIAAIGAIAAFITGSNQAVALEGGSKDWVINIHRILGITTACFLWLWAASFWIRPLRRWSLFVGLLTTLLILGTGFFGGVIAHG